MFRFFYGDSFMPRSSYGCMICPSKPPAPPPPQQQPSTSIFSCPQLYGSSKTVLSHEFDNNDKDVIYYYGEKYRSERSVNSMIMHLNDQMKTLRDTLYTSSKTVESENSGEGISAHTVDEEPQIIYDETYHEEDDDDNSSVSSYSTTASSTTKKEKKGSVPGGQGKNIVGKRNQQKYLPDGTLLRHDVSMQDGKVRTIYAIYDASKNIIIKQRPDGTKSGLAYDTLHQFAVLHANEVKCRTGSIENVWTDGNVKYWEVETNEWVSIGNLKKKSGQT
jgi:hypothetical protein